jgi:hypothetical protein
LLMEENKIVNLISIYQLSQLTVSHGSGIFDQS